MTELWQVWQRFWLLPVDRLPLATMRLVTGFTLIVSFFIYGLNLPHWLYGAPVFEDQLMLELYDLRAPYSFFNLAGSLTAAWVIYVLHFIPVILFTIGWGGRWTTFATYLAFCSIGNRNPAILFGFDEYMATFLIVFLIHPAMDYFSVKRGAFKPGALAPTIALRLFQFIFAVRYFAAGYYKPTAQWADGSVLWETLNNFEIWKYDISFLHPLWNSFGLMSLGIKLFELFFVPLILYRPTRNLAIGFGLLMHLGIGVMTPLMSFSWLMMVGYLAFIPSGWLRRLYHRVVKNEEPEPAAPPLPNYSQSA